MKNQASFNRQVSRRLLAFKQNNSAGSSCERWLLVGLALLLFALPSWGQGQLKTEYFQGQEAVANEVLVKFRPTMSPVRTLPQVKFVEDIDLAEGIGAGDVLRFHSRSKSVTTLVRELSAHPDVLYAEPNFIVKAIAVPNDPQFGQLWGLKNTGQIIMGSPGTAGADIGAVSAWDVSTGSQNYVIAVVDTGIDYTHPDLSANVWSAPSAFSVNIGGQIIMCPAGSHGFNAIKNVCDPMDDNGHGTHVSGTIGAVGNNDVGVVGVNWTTSIMGAKFLDFYGSGTTANAINAIEFAIQAKQTFSDRANVRVLSNSWGCQSAACFSQSLLDEINKANANEMLFVAAAGNAGSNNDITPFFPANYNAPNVLAVAATDNQDGLASFSDFGATTVHLGAPGVNIMSTEPLWGGGGGYGYMSGTSMATPHVSGAAGLVLSNCPYDTTSLKAALLNNVDPFPSLAGKTITGGRLDVNKAIRSCADFQLTATPIYNVNHQVVAVRVTVTAIRGFNGTVALSCSAPRCYLNPTSIVRSGSSYASGNIVGAVVEATSGSLVHYIGLVPPPPPCKTQPPYC